MAKKALSKATKEWVGGVGCAIAVLYRMGNRHDAEDLLREMNISKEDYEASCDDTDLTYLREIYQK